MCDINNNLDTSVTLVKGCLILTVPNDISDDDMEVSSKRILIKANKSSIKGVILDFSMMSVIDSYTFNTFEKVSKSLLLMGVIVIWIGLRPGVVSSLIDLNVDISCIKAAVNLEQALNMISKSQLNKSRSKIIYE